MGQSGASFSCSFASFASFASFPRRHAAARAICSRTLQLNLPDNLCVSRSLSLSATRRSSAPDPHLSRPLVKSQSKQEEKKRVLALHCGRLATRTVPPTALNLLRQRDRSDNLQTHKGSGRRPRLSVVVVVLFFAAVRNEFDNLHPLSLSFRLCPAGSSRRARCNGSIWSHFGRLL